MQTQQVGQPNNPHGHKPLPDSAKIILAIVTIAIITLIIVIGVIVKNQGITQQSTTLLIIPIVLTLISLVVGILTLVTNFLTWRFPVTNGTSEPSVTTAPPSQIPQIIVQVPPTPAPQPPPPDKPTYHGIVGFPPPTDPKTIQQRDKTVQAIYAKLTQPGLTALTLTGIGGIGKSTLAALIYNYDKQQRKTGNSPFSAEPLWLAINPTVTMVDLVGSLFEALDKSMPDLSNLSPENQAFALFNALNTVDNPRLVILDQFENLLNLQTGHALADRPGIGEWLDALNSQQCACRILLTSRLFPQGTRKYPSTYLQEYPVEGLEESEGIELLRKRDVKASEADLATAVQRCAGHALSLTLLPSLLQKRNLTLTTLLRDPAYTYLWIGDSGTIARNLLDSIFQQLDPVQRKLLVAFSVYREPVPLNAAQAILDGTPHLSRSQLDLALDALLSQHLLQPSGEGRYQPHPIVASYARGHFVEDDEQANHRAMLAAHAQAAQYYQQQAATSCPPREKRRQISDVHDLIESIWQYCQAGQWREAYDLMEQENIFADLNRWGGNTNLLEMYQQLFPLDKWNPERSQAADIYNSLGEVCFALGKKDETLMYFGEALDIRREMGDRKGEAETLNNLGAFYSILGKKEEALSHLKKALSIRKEIGDRIGEGETLNNLGEVYITIERKEEALKDFEQALRIWREIGNRGEEGVVFNNLGWLYNLLEQREEALKHLEQALSLSREVGNRGIESSILNNLGLVYRKMGQNEKARMYYEQALSLCREVKDRSVEGRVLSNLTAVYKALGQSEESLKSLHQVLTLFREIGDRGGEGLALNNLGTVYQSIGKNEEALKYYEQALAILREVGDRTVEGTALNNLGRLSDILGKKEEAFRYYQQAIRIVKEIKDRSGEGMTLWNIGRLYFKQQCYDIALASYLLSRSVFEELESPNRDMVQSWIDGLQQEIGEEQFATLLAQVEPQAHQIVEQSLHH